MKGKARTMFNDDTVIIETANSVELESDFYDAARDALECEIDTWNHWFDTTDGGKKIERPDQWIVRSSRPIKKHPLRTATLQITADYGTKGTRDLGALYVKGYTDDLLD